VGSAVTITPDPTPGPVTITPDAPAPNAGLAPPAGPSRKMDSGEGPIARGMTSFETQMSKLPENTVRLAGAKHWPIIDSKNFHELGEDIKSLNPVVNNDTGETGGIDIGATAANVLPMALGARRVIPEGAIGKLAQTGVEAGKTGLKLADVATFERGSKALDAVRGSAGRIHDTWNPPTYPGAHLPESPGYNPGAPFPEHPGTFPGAHLPDNPGVFPGAHLPENPGTFPGAHLPAAPPVELSQAGALMRGVSSPPDPSAGLGQIPVEPTYPGAPYPAARPPNAAQPTPSAWPPPEPTGAYGRTPQRPRSLADNLDDQAEAQGARDREAQMNRKWMKDEARQYRDRNDVSTPKGVMTGADERPITLTKTPRAKATGAASKSAEAAPADDPTLLQKLEQMQKIVDDLKKKGKRGS
jgi:hypothetical protein